MAPELQLNTLVMVDDDAEDVLILRTAALRSGQPLHLLHIGDGQALLTACSEAGLPERCVILLDLNMPTMDGFTVLQRLRKIPNCGLLPVVIYTTTSDQVQVDRAYANGANAFLTKPESLLQTTEMVAALILHWSVYGRVPSSLTSLTITEGPLP